MVTALMVSPDSCVVKFAITGMHTVYVRYLIPKFLQKPRKKCFRYSQCKRRYLHCIYSLAVLLRRVQI